MAEKLLLLNQLLRSTRYKLVPAMAVKTKRERFFSFMAKYVNHPVKHNTKAYNRTYFKMKCYSHYIRFYLCLHKAHPDANYA